MPYLPATSREEIKVPYGVDATAYPVEIAIVLKELGEPADSDYHAATWNAATLEAVLLIGRGTPVELAAGEYVVWARITTATQQPVRRSIALTVGTP